MQRARDRLREHGLPHAREVLDDQVALRRSRRARRARASRGALAPLAGGSRRRARRPRPPTCEATGSIRARGVGHGAESSRSTSSRTAAATTRFGAFSTTRSPLLETTTTSLSVASKPMSGPTHVVEDERGRRSSRAASRVRARAPARPVGSEARRSPVRSVRAAPIAASTSAVGSSSTVQRRTVLRALFLGGRRGPVVGDRRGHHDDVGIGAGERLALEIRRGRGLDDGHSRRARPPRDSPRAASRPRRAAAPPRRARRPCDQTSGSLRSGRRRAARASLPRTRARASRAGRSSRRVAASMRAWISSGSAMRPTPSSPSASSPSAGPTISTPRARSVATFSCVAGCCHIRVFIAGATRIGPVVREHGLRQDVVGEPVGEPREGVRGERRDHEQRPSDPGADRARCSESFARARRRSRS